jgi:precorrin-8X/cobalt-precorrin-8 methylmutase
MFDAFVMVDWSAANVPRIGRNSIWICWRGPAGERLENPDTRHNAKALLAEGLARAHANGERVLVGFDFPFGYPAGFAARLGLGEPPWRAAWDELACLIEDDERNANNRFAVAAALNRRLSAAGAGTPFWGCPAAAAGPHLGATRPSYTDGLAEKRLIDAWMKGAQPCWKLAYPGSVGSQVLTGVPVVRALRDDPRWAGDARVWPFETGFGAGDDARIIFCEIWPSWWPVHDRYEKPRDKAQVCTVAKILADRDRAGDLHSWFAPPIAAAAARQVLDEEAWTLGVTAPRQRASRTR